MVTTAYVIAALVGLALVVISLRFFLVPEAAAKGFGVPGSASGMDAGAYFSVKAVRDLGTALAIFVLIAVADAHTLGWVFLVMSVIPVGDALIVARRGGHAGISWGVHGGTALVSIAAGVLLLLG
ncbi:DUF4267 domain-containing protein [Nonomuraea angiospora]|uniref:DUF4267 domain-containing protein n=1 Tax=Nonomuraea angiospora TaxID=46172 RepID=UPI0029A64980|nr:DUF4267 domain-containing protein [Nonomuraea angiospora]MDX3104914.1 DUF4267 domain-containing protein [Nonomuraea angiospora]